MVDFRIGGPEQHVGTLRGARLYWKLMKCFKDLGQNAKCDDQTFCKDSLGCCQDECTIDHIVYEDGPGGYASNAYLKVRFWWAEIYDNYHPGLRELAVCIEQERIV